MIGRFTEPLVLQKSVKVSDGAFGSTETWTDLETVWCSVLSEEEVYGVENNQPTSTNRYKVRTHYRDDLTGDVSEFDNVYRFKWGANQLLIEGVRVIGQRYMMVEFTCTLINAGFEESEDTNNAFPYTFPFNLG